MISAVGTLRIIPIFCGARSHLLTPLGVELARVFHLEIEHDAPGFDPELAFDPERGQYNSRALLRSLLEVTPEHVTRVLGVAGVDLFMPVLTYVFGEAQLGGRAAIVSFHRLQSERYGLPEDPARLQERLVKEAVHELGHTYGLTHCADDRCVMHSSTYVEGIDQKEAVFCKACWQRLGGTHLDPHAPHPRRLD